MVKSKKSKVGFAKHRPAEGIVETRKVRHGEVLWTRFQPLKSGFFRPCKVGALEQNPVLTKGQRNNRCQVDH